MSTRRISMARPLALLAFASACGSSPPADPAKPAAEPAKAEPTKATPTKAEPAKAEPTKATPKPDAPAPALLRAAAVRRGEMTLMRQRGEPLLVIDGEPLLLVDGAFSRHPVGSAGLWPDEHLGSEGTGTLAAVSLEGLGTWTSTEHAFMRTGSAYEAYQRKDDHWERLPLRKGLLLAYYTAFAEREGALLALQGWSADPSQDVPDFDDGNPKAAAYASKLERELGRVAQGWVRLAGAESAALPEIPKGATLDGSVATTADGSLLALASERTAMGEGEAKLLLAWRPGQTKPERVEVPELATALEAKLDVDGEHTLVFGADGESESYLALGRGSEWQRVPVSLIGHLDGTTRTVSGAARRTDGELWISLAAETMRQPDPSPVWRKPVEGAWQAVPLPGVEAAKRSSGEPFAPDQAPGLVGAAGEVWVVVGGDTNEETEWKTIPSTTVLFTTAPGTAPPTVLPSSEELAEQRRRYTLAAAKPEGEQP